MITSNGYIDNPTFLGYEMAFEKTFDKIYVIDLHGNSRKKKQRLMEKKMKMYLIS